MRQTITNMLGTLPPQFFDVSVSTIGENLAQMMYSVMMTGYMFRNAQTNVWGASVSHRAQDKHGSAAQPRSGRPQHRAGMV
eukprot:2031492-Pyramimonas_sp.AAC.1